MEETEKQTSEPKMSAIFYRAALIPKFRDLPFDEIELEHLALDGRKWLHPFDTASFYDAGRVKHFKRELPFGVDVLRGAIGV